MVELIKSQYGNWASLVGLVLSLLAWRQAKKAAKSAENARASAIEAKRALRQYDATQDLRRLITDLYGIIPLHFRAAWDEVYFRYDPIREIAVRIKASPEYTNMIERKVLEDTIAMLNDLAETIEEAKIGKRQYPDPAHANRRVRQYAQSLEEFEVLKAHRVVGVSK